MANFQLQSEAGSTDAIAIIAKRLQLQPTYVVRDDRRNRFYVAKWDLPPHHAATECLTEHALICQIGGSTLASKIADGKVVRRPGHRGTITFIPTGEHARYAVDDDSTLLQLYISPTLVRQFCAQHAKGGNCISIQSFFAVEDSWLAGYFQMLIGEIETYRGGPYQFDSLFLGQAQQLLFGHLLRTYADVGAIKQSELDRPPSGYALRPHLFKRVTEFIRANLTGDIYLKDMAELVHLSEAHFIRAFHAAAGCTPYQYALEERLRASADLLRTNDTLSVRDVATFMGFKSQSHFATMFKSRYKVTPTRYRHGTDG